MKDKFIPVWEFSKLTGITMSSIYRWIKEGRIGDKDYKRVIKQVERTLIRKDLQVARLPSGKVNIKKT